MPSLSPSPTPQGGKRKENVIKCYKSKETSERAVSVTTKWILQSHIIQGRFENVFLNEVQSVE